MLLRKVRASRMSIDWKISRILIHFGVWIENL